MFCIWNQMAGPTLYFLYAWVMAASMAACLSLCSLQTLFSSLPSSRQFSLASTWPAPPGTHCGPQAGIPPGQIPESLHHTPKNGVDLGRKNLLKGPLFCTPPLDIYLNSTNRSPQASGCTWRWWSPSSLSSCERRRSVGRWFLPSSHQIKLLNKFLYLLGFCVILKECEVGSEVLTALQR